MIDTSDIHIKHFPEYMQVKIEGTYYCSEFFKLIDVITQAAIDNQHKFMLMDINSISRTMSITDKYFFGATAAKEWAGKITIAIVADADNFLESVMVNRGTIASVHSSRKDAARWLNFHINA